MKKSCNNCKEYIVCYGLDEIEIDKGENCANWTLDFAEYQNLFHIDSTKETQENQ